MFSKRLDYISTAIGKYMYKPSTEYIEQAKTDPEKLLKYFNQYTLDELRSLGSIEANEESKIKITQNKNNVEIYYTGDTKNRHIVYTRIEQTSKSLGTHLFITPIKTLAGKVITLIGWVVLCSAIYHIFQLYNDRYSYSNIISRINIKIQ